ncbi:MAG: hypothetical protein WBQ73_02205 [Candidatus Babeliales bacterium]
MEKKIFLTLFICAALCSGFSRAGGTSTLDSKATVSPQVKQIIHDTFRPKDFKQKTLWKSETLEKFDSLLSKTLTNNFTPSYYRAFCQEIDYNKLINRFASNRTVSIYDNDNNRIIYTFNAGDIKKIYCGNNTIIERDGNTFVIAGSTTSTFRTFLNYRNGDTNKWKRRVVSNLLALTLSAVVAQKIHSNQALIYSVGTSIAYSAFSMIENNRSQPNIKDPNFANYNITDNILLDQLFNAGLYYGAYFLYKKNN